MQSSQAGYPRWQITLAVVFLSQMFTAIGFSMVFPFLPAYVSELGSVTGLSVEWMAGLVISSQAFTMMLVSPLWGAVADRYGRKLMVMRAMFGGTVILALMGMVTNGEQLILLRAVQGTITGTVAANNALAAGVVPRERIGFAMGLLQIGQWGGFSAGPLLGGILADNFGYANSFFITAAALLFSGILVYFGVDEQFTPSENSDEERPNMFEQWQHVLAARGVSIVYGMRFLVSTTRVMIVPIAPLFILSLLPEGTGNSNTLIGSVTAVSDMAAAISGVYLGRLGDRIGHKNVLFVAAGAAAVLTIPQIFVDGVGMFWVWRALSGLAIGGVISAPSALLARYTETGEEGAVYGLDNAVTSSSRFIAPMLAILVTDLFGGMRAVFGVTALYFLIIAAIAYWFLPSDVVARKFKTAPAIGD